MNQLLLLLALPMLAEADQPERCGTCWCVPEGGLDVGECPAYEGVTDGIPESWKDFYVSFQDNGNSNLPLETAQGSSDCFPFKDAVGSIQNYAQSNLPQCKIYEPNPVTGQTNQVCAYLFDNAEDSCSGRGYEAVTFASEADALAAAVNGTSVQIVHLGACGVCSNAQDYAVRMTSLPIMDAVTALCAAQYFTKPADQKEAAFGDLVTCIQNGIPFTTPCATLWAHFGATNAFECALECISVTAEADPIWNEDPPTCELVNCLQCSATKFEQAFNQISGIWKGPYNGGIVDEVGYPCPQFYKVDNFNPCKGTPPTPAPTPMPGDDDDDDDDSGALSSYATTTVHHLLILALGAYHFMF